jgi:electron transport complex protein RnfC
VPLHAPATGTVSRIGPVLTASGAQLPGLELDPLPASTQAILEGAPVDPERASPREIIEGVRAAGIVGLGGAAFPTHVKLAAHEGRDIDTLLVNGVECEPMLTTDHRVMLEQAADVWSGVHYLLIATGARRAVVAVEANKADAAAALEQARPEAVPGEVRMLPVKYPQGAERILVESVLGRRVPAPGLPADVGVVCLNVATTAEIGRLLPRGRAILERVVTVTGSAVRNPGNYRIPIGTPLRFVLDHVGLVGAPRRVFLGGPMMGQAVASLEVGLTKGTTGVVASTAPHATAQTEQPCIRCGRCVRACPLWLDPARLGLLSRYGRYEEMRDEYRLAECFECGACAYVCPAHIPLVQLMRVAKSALRDRAA